MSKGLKALEKIVKTMSANHFENQVEELSLIEKELKRLEELEKAFKALSKDDEKAKKLLSLEIEKNRAFEIIKEKKVDVAFIIENPGPEAKNVFWYNSSFTGVLCEGWRMLSQEEYDLLRKALL